MEQQRQRQKKKRDKLHQSKMEYQIPDAPTLEEFECLLGESPTNYPKGEGIENMESELHSAAIDTEIYEKEAAERAAHENRCNLQEETVIKVPILVENSCDEVDTVLPSMSPDNTLAERVEQVSANISAIELVDISSNLTKEAGYSSNCVEDPIVLTIHTSCQKPSTKQTKVSENIKDVKPYTDHQLASLYHNQELALVDAFVSEFTERQLRYGILKQQHRLHELLMNYLRVRNYLIANSYELESLKKRCRETQRQLWCLEKTSLTENGECQDGNPVSATHEYSIAHFNQQTLVALSRTLSAIKDALHNSQALYCYEAESLRLQIEHYVQGVIGNLNELASLTQTGSANLLPEQSPSHSAPQLVELRMCVTILFNFQRKILKDGKFVADTREWLSKLVALLLRVATWQDHTFLLCHVLRCPGGVMNWTKAFVQVPVPAKVPGLSVSPFNDPYLDHTIATLAVILSPIKDREKFLEQVQSPFQDTSSPADTVWVMLDEEGEEEEEDIANTGVELFESDLISLLQQVPLDKLFESVLFVQCHNDEYRQERHAITDHHMLRLFAFYTLLVKLLRQGLMTYDTPRYRQLAKRLSALIRDVVQYASDQWEAFDRSKVMDESTLLKLQIEYDCFFLRATLCIFSSRRLGAWQYLATIPYHIVSSTTLWHIFYILHTDSVPSDTSMTNTSVSDWETELSYPLLHEQFEENLSNMPGDESYFLLTTFANMAIARGYQDYDFVKTTTIDLFQIGFLSEKTQESCSKDARSLLSNLTSKYPTLLSDILQKLKDNFVSVGKLSLYLFTQLNIGMWVPQKDDITILSTWLHQHPLTSSENHLARLIFTHLNWALDANGSLYLPIDLHRRVALLIVELTMKYAPDTQAQTASLLAEGIKQVSSMMRPQNNEQAFNLWAWEMLNRLRLHQLDQSESVSRYTVSNLTEALSRVPDIESDSFLEVLVKGVREKQPVACYVSVLMTLWGHSMPLICTQGFGQMQTLQCYYKYEQVLVCLHHTVPLFLECPDSLLKNDKFVSLIVPLVTADRTYIKMAKNLITPEFPGPILRQFSYMIESHLHHYKRYCLNSPERFVHLWLNVLLLVQDWNKDHSVMYLMDTVIRAAFFHLDTRVTMENMFQNLFCNISSNRASGSFGSFLSWATGSSGSASLLGGTVQTVWVAYQVLSMEQYDRELKTGLWREILQELSMQSKTPLDTALKRACATVKMTPFGVNNLAIYRWSQQALDTTMDHPILPLLWQNFFTLFLARIPTIPGSADQGGAGEKFFEGMINLSYLKKLKKRLHETTEYFQAKGEKSSDNEKLMTDERRVFYLSLAKFYKTLSLWLEEPRLQEPGLYLPALPPQYMSQKLILLVQGNRTPWLEYVDYWSVQQSQLKAINEWERGSFRGDEKHRRGSCQHPSTSPTLDPLRRIYRRLNSYEPSIPPPPLARNQPVLNHVSRESLHNSATVIDLVRPHLRTILEYAQTYNLIVSEHTAVDCSFLELVPTLYRTYENEVTLHALCDPAPSGTRRSRSGTPPTVHCAGPAIVKIKVTEAHVSDGVDHMISQNRAEYENLLVKASQPPPSKVTLSCIFTDHLITMLEHELAINRTNDNTMVLRKVQESGVQLFYHLVGFYTEEAISCPATKQLITTCLEKLGHLFISGEESQGLQLLNTIIQRPNLGGLLGPHFTPIAGGASAFLQMYQIIVDLSTGSNVDLCFVLLSKFDVSNWLNYRRPRLSERSTFIELVSKALCNIGLNPEEEKLMLHEVFRNHLRLILLHEFPEHYGEVLSAVLRGSESQNLSLDVWRDLLGALSGKPKSSAPTHASKIRDEIRHYATEQRLLSRQEIYDTAVLLSRHFMKERLQYGLYGLYPKYRVYNEPLTVFLGMIAHALVVLTLQADRGSLADQLCEKIWPILSEMYAPWVSPYWTRTLREPTAAWIQQLTDDRSVLLPWIITDGPYANRTFAMFVECVRFIIDTMPASSKILSYVWQFYVTNYAHVSVKEHVLNVVHSNFLSLPWDHFSPTTNDIELMIKIIDQYLPDCHLFLGNVFTCINWSGWINDLFARQAPPVAARMHVCLLNLLVKLSNESNVRQNEKATQLVAEAECFSWHLVDATSYDHVINWYVMSCDPRVILCLDGDQTHPIDTAINNLLKIAAAYDPSASHFHPTTLKKRHMYVRASVKLLINCTTKYKSLLSTNSKVFTGTLSRMLDEMETVVTSTVSEPQQVTEAGLLITEFLHSSNHSVVLVELLRTSWSAWLSERTAGNPVLMGMLRVMGMAVASPSVLGHLMEAALEAYFKHNVIEDSRPTWGSVLTVIQSVIPRQPPLESVLVSERRLLALYSVLLKKLPSCRDIREEGMLLINLVDWITAIKTTDIVEEKLPLFWAKTCELSYRQCQYSENTVIAARALKGLARVLLTVADDAGQGWGILGAIGLRKGSQLSIRCKFLSRAVAVYCLAQLPESKSEQQLVRHTPHSAGVAPTRSADPDAMEIRPSAEAVKAMQTLEGLLTNKQYSELRANVERSIRLIRDSANSLHNAVEVIGNLAAELYNQRYLHVITE